MTTEPTQLPIPGEEGIPPAELPPPPKEEEFFPGFGVELRKMGELRFRAGQRIELAQRRLSELQSQWSMRAFWQIPDREAITIPILPLLHLQYIPEEEFERLRQAAQAEIDFATQEFSRFSWRQQVLMGLPYMLVDRKSNIQTIEDVYAAMPNSYLLEGDRQWMERTFERLSYLVPPELPEAFQGDPGQVRVAMLEQILAEPKLELAGVHNLTVAELIKSFQVTPEPLPPGMTTNDVRDILTELEFDEETQAEINDIHSITEELQRDWKEQAAYIDLVRAGLAIPGAPELTPWEFTKMLFTQPMLASLELLEKYFNILPRPLAAWAVIHFPRINPESDAAELERLFEHFQEVGVNDWEAYSLAFQNWGTNIWLKMFIETMFDPTTYIGLGIATKVTKPIPYIGRFIGAIERGWVELWDIPFRGLRRAIKAIPKTPGQRATSYARQAFTDTRAYLRRMLGKDLVGLTAPEIKEAMEFAIRQSMDMPWETGNLAVRVGRYLTDYDFIEMVTVRQWVDDFAVSAEKVTKQLVNDVNYQFDLFYRKAYTSQEVASTILTHVGVDNAADNIGRLASTLERYRDKLVSNALDVTTGDSAKAALNSIFRHVEDMNYRKAFSPVYNFATQTGRATSWMTRSTDRMVRSNMVSWVDRHITAPMANQYLLFTNYGPFNVLENSMRSFLGGGEIMYPRASSPVDELVRIGDGLTNLPYEFVSYQRGIGRLEMAIIDPKTGKTQVFSKGRIPGITKELPTGFKINIGTQEYNIRSWQHWNDMFGDIGTKQRARYLTVKYKQFLGEIAPDDIAAIAKVFDDNDHLLAGIKSLAGEKDDIVRILQQDATVSPDMIRKHDVPMIDVERRRALLDINKSLDRCTDIYSPHKQTIRDAVLDGRIWKDIDGSIAGVAESIKEFNIVGLQAEARTLDNLVKEMAEMVPQNSDEVLRTMGFISDLVDGISERISDVRALTRSRAAKLIGTEADDFHRASSEILAEFLGKSQDDISSILDNLHAATRKAGLLTDDQLSVLDNLTEGVRLRHANAVSTRDLDRRIINEAVSTTPRNKRDAAFWNRLDAKRSLDAWEPYWAREADLFEAVEDLKTGFMTALGIEPTAAPVIPQVTGQLAPAHIAYILGTTGDDLNKALTKVGAMVTIRPKNKFITWIYAKAKKSAAKVGSTADDLGYTREAIGDCYDQMFRNLGIDPGFAAREPMTPSMLQLEDVRQDLHRIAGTKGIPESEYLQLKNYIGSVANDLEQLPIYRAEFMGKPRITVKGNQYNLNMLDDAGKRVAVVNYFDRPDDILVGNILSLSKRGGFGTQAWMEGPQALALSKGKRLAGLTSQLTDEGRAFIDSLQRRGIIRMGETVGDVFYMTPIRKGLPAPTTNWWAKKDQAMMKARTQYELDFTDYSNRNMVDAAMRQVFPFWTYEWQRYFWLPRTFLRTPGTATGLGRYMEYSDQGYIPIPGTDIQFNPTRGTVFMGGFRRLMLRDYPEYYDAMPGMEIIDYISRLGFYPGFHIMLPIILIGALSGKPEYGELAPAWVKTGLNAARAVAPEQAGKVIDHIFPDRFRDYLTMLTLGEQGYDADEIWRKRKGGQKLTEEEEKLWLRAEAKATGLKGILMEQGGVFRIRPPEYTQFRKDGMELIEEMTGVPVNIQETINRRYAVTGKRFSDYYKLDSLQQKILYELEAYERWQGVTTPLYPSAWQEEDIKVRDYFERVEGVYDDYRANGVYDEQGNLISRSVNDLTSQWVTGEIGPDQWVSARGDLLSKASAAIMEMGKRDYPDVPKTLDEREARFKERGIPAPTYSPDQEIIYKYYDIKPELHWDWEAGRETYDFDTYYAKIDAIVETLQGEFRQRFIDRIQYEWNGMERLYWQTSREYLRPYRLVRNLVLEQYTEEQRKAIRRFEVARGAERDALRAMIGPEGDKLISHFQREVREARQRLRMLDPELDAWAYFFGITDTLLSEEAKQLHSQFEKQYLIAEMASNV